MIFQIYTPFRYNTIPNKGATHLACSIKSQTRRFLRLGRKAGQHVQSPTTVRSIQSCRHWSLIIDLRFDFEVLSFQSIIKIYNFNIHINIITKNLCITVEIVELSFLNVIVEALDLFSKIFNSSISGTMLESVRLEPFAILLINNTVY